MGIFDPADFTRARDLLRPIAGKNPPPASPTSTKNTLLILLKPQTIPPRNRGIGPWRWLGSAKPLIEHSFCDAGRPNENPRTRKNSASGGEYQLSRVSAASGKKSTK